MSIFDTYYIIKNLSKYLYFISVYSIILCRKYNGDNNMDVCYSKLRRLLIDKGLKISQFAKEIGISAPTLAKLSKNEYVSMEIIVRIYKSFDCEINDIMDI